MKVQHQSKTGRTLRGVARLGAIIAAVAVTAVVVGAACTDGDDNDGVPAITIEEAWARQSPMSPGMMNGGDMNGGMDSGMNSGGDAPAGPRGAAYMLIRNEGEVADRLVAASSDIAASTEVHESRMEGDVVTMEQVEYIDIPAGGTTELKPGGYHVMFIGLNSELVAGETVEVVLHFEESGDVTVEAVVREQ
jgi:copper(I)-binding protein